MHERVELNGYTLQKPFKLPLKLHIRANSKWKFIGLTSLESSLGGKVLKSDVNIAKNYLFKEELNDLARIVNAFLELAESHARRKIPMMMQDWAERIDILLYRMGARFPAM